MEARQISVQLRRDPREIAERHSQANPLTLSCVLARGETVEQNLSLYAELHDSRTPASVPLAASGPVAMTTGNTGPWELDFTSAQMNQTVLPGEDVEFWLVVYAVGGGELYTLATIRLTLQYDNVSQVTPPPPTPALFLDLGGTQWKTGQEYAADDIVALSGSIYVCAAANTSSAANEPGVGANWSDYWTLFSGGPGGSGDVTGPASSVNNTLPRFSGTTGKVLKGSSVTVSDTGGLLADTLAISTTPTGAGGTGIFRYDTGEKVPEVGIDGITLKIGVQEYVRVYNDTVSTLTKGQIVYISGAQGNRVAVRLADASVEATSAGTLGLVAQSITAGSEGFVQVSGPMYQLNTLGLTAGALLYLSETAGQWTQTEPAAPAHGVRIGYVQRVDASVGSVFVKIDNGYELGELHNVSDSANNITAFLVKNSSTNIWTSRTATEARSDLQLGSLATQSGTFSGASSGTNTGDVTLSGTGYLSLTGQALTASPINLASHVTGTLPIASGGTGATTAANALTSLGAYAASNPAGYTSNTGTVTSVTGTAPISVSNNTTTPAITVATFGTSNSGVVPSSGGGTANFLRADGTWSIPLKASRASNASDVFIMGSDEVLTPVDKNANALVIWDDTNSKLTYATLGSGLSFNSSTGELSITGGGGGIAGSTGSTDNAVLRSDGTGGSTLQASGLSIDDVVNSFSGLTGDAGTDVITAPGTAFADGQAVRFRSLTGGSGLNTTTNYFVRDVSGTTFKVATSAGGTAVNFTTNITAGVVVAGHFVQPFVGLAQNTADANSSLVLVAQGTGALIFGPRPDGTATGGNARGLGAIDLQTSRTTATQIASGERSLLFGNESTASGAYAVAGGNGSVSTALYSLAIGQSCSSTAESAFAYGKINTASADLGYSTGERALANRRGMFARAAGQFSVIGDAQVGQMVLRRSTTDATQTELTIDGATPTGTVIQTSNRFILLANQAVMADAYIVARSTGGADHACYHRRCLIQRTGTTTALVGSVERVGTDIESSGASAWDVTLAADDTNESLQILVTGAASTTIRWVCELKFREVILA